MHILHERKYNLLNPLSRIVDIETGPESVRMYGHDPDDWQWTIVDEPDLAFLNYRIYCELFHHDVDQNFSTSSPQSLDLKTCRRWIAYCTPDINNHRNRHREELQECQHLSQTRMWHFSQCFTKPEMALQLFFETGELREFAEDDHIRGRTYPPDYDRGFTQQRVNLCIAVAEHLGVESLKMLRPGGLLAARERLEQIREAIGRIPDAEMRARRDDREWFGIASEFHEGIATNMMSEQELAEEETGE